jgi:hypothetical protein
MLIWSVCIDSHVLLSIWIVFHFFATKLIDINIFDLTFALAEKSESQFDVSFALSYALSYALAHINGNKLFFNN